MHKKHILESAAANVKFTCKLYLIAICILLNWEITYHGELSINFIARSHITPQWNLCKGTSTQNYAMQVIWSICQFN